MKILDMEVGDWITNPLIWVGVYLLFDLVKMIVGRVIKNRRHNQLVLKAQRVREKRDADVKEFVRQHENLIPDDNVKSKIMECNSIAELQRGLENGEFISVDLLMFYIERCSTYGVKLNLITDPFFEEALQIAKDCDETRKDPVKMEDIRQNTETKGLLFGIPISIKDLIFKKGSKCTLGCINLVDYIHEKESALESLIKKNGGIIFTKTNVPMLLLSLESNNRIYGKAMNPYNHDRVPGGSSGGCAALVACNGTSLSLGTDIGGSLRAPASFCGTYCFKPSLHRMSQYNCSSLKELSCRGQEQILSCVGPITKSLDDSILIMKMMFNSYSESKNENFELCNDPGLVPLKFNEEEFEKYRTKRKLTIGYFIHNELFDCMNPCAEAVLTTIRTLEKEGHKCIEIDSNIFKSFFEIYCRLMLSVNLNLSAVGAEHLLPDFNNVKLSYSIPTLIKPLLSKILVMLGERRKSFVLNYIANKSIFDYNHQCFDKIELSQKMEEMYKSLNLDAIISPVLPFPAFKHGQFNNLVQGVTYSSMFNFFDYPTAVIPRVHIVNETDTIPENYVDRNYGVDSYTKAARENIVGAKGLPVGIQISSLTYQDEQCMGVAKQIDSILQKHEIIQKNRITKSCIIVEFIKIAK